jgi:hypothetical protein
MFSTMVSVLPSLAGSVIDRGEGTVTSILLTVVIATLQTLHTVVEKSTGVIILHR